MSTEEVELTLTFFITIGWRNGEEIVSVVVSRASEDEVIPTIPTRIRKKKKMKERL